MRLLVGTTDGTELEIKYAADQSWDELKEVIATGSIQWLEGINHVAVQIRNIAWMKEVSEQ